MTTLALGIPTVTFPDPSGVTAAIPATTMVAPAVPATTVTASNTTNQPYTVVVTDNGAVYSAVLVNGVSVTVTDTYLVPAYGGISLAYTGGPPTWTWTATRSTVGAPTLIGANTAFTFRNVPSGLVYIHAVIGPSGAGNFVFTGLRSHPNLTVPVQNYGEYLMGPFDPVAYSDNTGLVVCTPTVVTGNAVEAYIVPASKPLATYGALHNPFSPAPGAADS